MKLKIINKTHKYDPKKPTLILTKKKKPEKRQYYKRALV